jgi:hypothetical protein
MKTTIHEEWALAARVESGYEGPMHKTVTIGYSVIVTDESFDPPFEREYRFFETLEEAERYAARFA